VSCFGGKDQTALFAGHDRFETLASALSSIPGLSISRWELTNLAHYLRIGVSCGENAVQSEVVPEASERLRLRLLFARRTHLSCARVLRPQSRLAVHVFPAQDTVPCPAPGVRRKEPFGLRWIRGESMAQGGVCTFLATKCSPDELFRCSKVLWVGNELGQA
jgi:hypothetical protein